ncbi:MAG TPA: hypothetical protein VF081_12345 [Solirubrobacterales bacterium]
MNFSELLLRSPLARRVSMAMLAFAATAAIGGSLAPPVDASVFGQSDAWGTKGTEAGQIMQPALLGVDPGDGSVYVGDYPETLGNARIQKFSAAGAVQASVEIPLPLESGKRIRLQGIVVDSVKDRIYLLQYRNQADTSNGKTAAQLIHVFSTVPDGSGNLVAPAGGPATLPVPSPTEANALDNPQQLALDPASGDLIISAEDRTGNFVLQRIGTSGSGSIGARYTETTETAELDQATTAAGALTGLFTVGPDGTTYIITSKLGETETLRAWTLAADLSGAPTALPGFTAAVAEEKMGLVISELPSAAGGPGFGPQAEISAEGDALYWKERLSALDSTSEEPGNYLVRKYSIPDRHTTTLFGGKGEELSCTIQTAAAPLASVGDDLVVLDPGQLETEPLYGVHVLRFGAGGSGCPAPGASFKLKSGATEVSSVPAGSSVTLDGTASEVGTLQSPTLTSVTWKIEGPGGPFEQTVPSSDPNPLKLDHVFASGGEYTIRMLMKVSGTEYPVRANQVFAAKARKLTVQGGAPKHKLTVTSNGGTGTGTVTSNPAGVNCGIDCEEEYDEGTEVELLKAAAAGSEFKEWTGACTGTGTCKVTMSAAKTVGAKFDLAPAAKHKLTVTSNGGTGSGKVTSNPAGIDCGADCEQEYDQGTEVELLKTANAGSEFKEWTGACTGTGTCKVTMSAAKTVGAKFDLAPKPKFKLTASKSGTGAGTITSNPAGINCGADCEQEYDQGTEVELLKAAAAGSEFKEWTGACTGTGTCKVTMSAAKTVGVKFEAVNHALTVTKAGSGAGSVFSSPAGINCGPTCLVSFKDGTLVTLTAMADAGSTFAGWGGVCSGTGTCVVTLSAAKSVTATFNAVALPQPTCLTDPSLCPKIQPTQPTKPFHCKKGFKKKKVNGKLKCVKVKKKKKKH